MNKAGGIIALIAGIFGFFAAIFTIFMGGAIDALGSSRHDSQSIFDFGLWGLFFSCAIIILGAIAIGVQNRKIGISIVVLSLFGIVLGGTPVAICLMLSSVGGILCIVGGKKNDVVIAAPLSTITPITNSTLITPASTPIQLFPKPVKKKTPIITWIAFAIFVPLGVLVIVGMFANKKTTENNQITPSSDSDNTQNTSPDSSNDDPIATLKKATPSDIAPNGKLAELFNLGSKNTDLQREDAFNAIKGQVVEWTLPVYEVERDGDKGYKIQTGQGDYVGTFIYITPQNANDDIIIKNLKTDDMIKIKGIISDESMRNLEIKPAIIVNEAAPVTSINTPSTLKSTNFTGQQISGYVGGDKGDEGYKNNSAFNNSVLNIKKGSIVKLNIGFDKDQNDEFYSSLKTLDSDHTVRFSVAEGADIQESGATEYNIVLPQNSTTYKFNYLHDKAKLEGCFYLADSGGPQMMQMWVSLKAVPCK